MNKQKISVSLSKDVLKWIDQEREKAPYDPSRSAFIEEILREKKKKAQAESLGE